MSLLFDSGAFVALEGNDRAMWNRLKACRVAGTPPLTHAGVVGQVWRGGSRQARLAMALESVDVRPLDEALGRAAGVLLGRSRTKDVVDAALVLLAEDGDDIVTGDVADLQPLAMAAGRHIELIPV